MADRAPLTYDFLPPVPSFTVTSEDVAAGVQMSDKQVYNSFGMTGDTARHSCHGPGSRRRPGASR